MLGFDTARGQLVVKRRLILSNHQSPGDILMLTAAVRDLMASYSNVFAVDVRTSSPGLWENNPYLTDIPDDDAAAERIACEYPLVNRSNELPYHFIHGFRKDLEEKLGLDIPAGPFRGDIHLSPEEWEWMSQVEEYLGQGARYWIIVAGGKFDFTIKWWVMSRWQEVVDALAGRVRFVQVGSLEHYHPKLQGVLDLRGRTNLRELVRLVFNADGVLTPVSLCAHLAAAVPFRHRPWALRPCVVVAGGREPPHWEAYPGHQYLHTIGALKCCSSGGCWKSRTVPLGDNDEKDRPNELCEDVVDCWPRCMNMIGVDEVVRSIERYLVEDESRSRLLEPQDLSLASVRSRERRAIDKR